VSGIIVENSVAYVVRLIALPSAATQPGGVVVVLANQRILPTGILSLDVVVLVLRFHFTPS
jgi:hypothetical protein